VLPGLGSVLPELRRSLSVLQRCGAGFATRVCALHGRRREGLPSGCAVRLWRRGVEGDAAEEEMNGMRGRRSVPIPRRDELNSLCMRGMPPPD
jgi:hypothetical protein